MHGGMYYFSDDLFMPQVGDVRVQFYYAGRAGDVVSILT